MLSLVTAMLAASLLCTILAIPSPSSTSNGSFAVKIIPNPKFVAHGPTAMYKTYLKYRKAPPIQLVETVMEYRAHRKARRGSGSAATLPEEQDKAWLTPVHIGTPAQTFNLDFDSGSSDLWVFSTSTLASQSRGHALYDPGKSSSAQLKSGYSWSISYGDGSSSSGTVYADSVTVGGVTAASQAIEAAGKISIEFTEDTDLDGILGLAFSSINSVRPTTQNTFFDSIKMKLDQHLWTADLRHQAPGTYNFGKIDSSLYLGEINYAIVDARQGFWSFTATSYRIGGGRPRGSITGLVDTGTSLALFPPAVVTAYYAQVLNASYSASHGGHIFPCHTILPDFTFTINKGDITIPGEYLNYAPLGPDGKTCFGGIQGNAGIGQVIFGDVILKATFVVFETSGSTPRIGWARKNLT